MRIQRPTYRTSAALLAAWATCLSGCGSGLSDVSGAITLDGQPVQARDGVTATVMFQPLAGGPPAVGKLDAEGRYHIATGSQSGLTPGEYAVTCAINKVIPSTNGGAASAKGMSDPKYSDSKTSGFSFTVKPGSNEFDLALESPKKAGSARGR